MWFSRTPLPGRQAACGRWNSQIMPMDISEDLGQKALPPRDTRPCPAGTATGQE